MITFKKISTDKVAIIGNDITIISAECNILPHPQEPDYILISEKATPQQAGEALKIDYKQIAGQTFANRNDAILFLNKYFSLTYRLFASDFFKDAAGNSDFKGNYASTPKIAFIRPNGNRTLYINRIIGFIADAGSVDAGYYGNSLVLTNGIRIIHQKQNGTLIREITQGHPIKTNADYAKFGFQISDISFGSGLNHVHVVLTLSKDGTALALQPDEELIIKLNDNFTGLKAHTFKAGAFYIEP